MLKNMSDYLDEVCAEVRGKSLKQMARVELADHMNERFAEIVAEGNHEEHAALETVKRMGVAAELGKRITKANRSPIGIFSVLLGPLLLLATFFFIFTVLRGFEITWFFDGASFVAVAGLAAGYGIICIKGKFTLYSFLREAKTGAVYGGIICMVICVITTFQTMSEGLEFLGNMLATSLISLLYGVILSAAARIAENHANVPEAGVIKSLLE